MAVRPSWCSYPHVWRKFQRSYPDGSVRHFSVQDIPQDMEDDVVNFMYKYYFPDEPLSMAAKFLENPLWQRQMNDFWRMRVLPQKLSLVCLEDNLKSTSEKQKPKVIAVNFLLHCDKNNTKNANSYDEPVFRSVAKKGFEDGHDVFQMFGVDMFLGSAGLGVRTEHRGMSIGTEMLLARAPLGQAFGYKLTKTYFFSIPSQVVATKAGFKLFMEIQYSELEARLSAQGIECIFPKECTTIKVMTKTLE